MTSFIKKNEIKNNWVLIDAENIVVGRLAAYISLALRGKNKGQYTPHMDTWTSREDFVWRCVVVDGVYYKNLDVYMKDTYTIEMDGYWILNEKGPNLSGPFSFG